MSARIDKTKWKTQQPVCGAGKDNRTPAGQYK